MKPVAVYQDYVHNNGSLAMMLQDLGITFKYVNADDALDGFSVLVMPGGADLYYCEKLNSQGNRRIRAFIEAGGGYLGICAGAYYGCTTLDWNNGEIAGGRELGLIDACAIGPVLEFIEDGDIKKSWYAAPEIKTDLGTFPTLYAAGPVFTNIKDDVDVLASYAAHGPAVIGRRVGRGYAVLSSPHIEVAGKHFAAGRYTHNSPRATHEAAVAKKLAGFDGMQQKFFKSILQKAGWSS